MTLLSRHILREFMTLVVSVLLGILVVYLCIEFLQKADKLIKFHATMSQVARYFLYSIPSMISLSLPMSTLIASMLSLGNLSRHNEIIAMRSSGVSLGRIIFPMILGGLAISACGFFVNEYVMPEYTSKAEYVRNVEIEKKQQRVIFQQRKLWLRGPDNSIANIDLIAPSRTEMIGLNIYKLTPDFAIRERVKAASLKWENGAWRLQNSRTYTPEAGGLVTTRSSDGEVFNIVESPDDLGTIVKDAEAMSFNELWEYIKRLRTGGYKTAAYEVDLYSKVAFPFSSLLMVMISIPFSVHKVRSGGAGKGFAFAVLIAFVYWMLASVGQSLGRSGAIPPVAAAWVANGVFGVAALFVLLRLERTV